MSMVHFTSVIVPMSSSDWFASREFRSCPCPIQAQSSSPLLWSLDPRYVVSFVHMSNIRVSLRETLWHADL